MALPGHALRGKIAIRFRLFGFSFILALADGSLRVCSHTVQALRTLLSFRTIALISSSNPLLLGLTLIGTYVYRGYHHSTDLDFLILAQKTLQYKILGYNTVLERMRCYVETAIRQQVTLSHNLWIRSTKPRLEKRSKGISLYLRDEQCCAKLFLRF